jgi:predicted permease
MLFPLGVLALLACIPLEATDKFIIFLQATMPVAATLLVIGHYEEADNAFLSGSIFYSHLVAIVTVPAWLYLFSLIF